MRSLWALLFVMSFAASASAIQQTQTQSDKPASEAKPSPTPKKGDVIDLPIGETSHIPTQGKDKESDTATAPKAIGGIEILSNTRGVDFSQYMKRMHALVEAHWYPLIPSEALPPTLKSGTVTIEFSIRKDGSVQDLKIVGSSGDTFLDRAAYGAIVGSAPLPSLPAEFTADYLWLRSSFVYNPAPKSQPSRSPEAAPLSDKTPSDKKTKN